MVGFVVALVPRLSINAVKLPHVEGKIGVGSLYHEVVVIVHKALRVTEPLIALVDEGKDFEKCLSVLVTESVGPSCILTSSAAGWLAIFVQHLFLCQC